MTRVVISQPMFFPWPGLIEQVGLADHYVHFDDVQLPQGRSFMSRVQIKTPRGVEWLTVPVCKGAALIKEARVDDLQPWRTRHLRTLRHNYARAPYVGDMLGLVEAVYALDTTLLADINAAAIESVARYFALEARFARSSTFAFQSTSSRHLLDLVLALGGTVYVTGHGARNYLDHEMFEHHGVQVEYMEYRKVPYPQQFGDFTPYVSVLDLVANVGREGRAILCSGTLHWRDFVR